MIITTYTEGCSVFKIVLDEVNIIAHITYIKYFVRNYFSHSTSVRD